LLEKVRDIDAYIGVVVRLRLTRTPFVDTGNEDEEVGMCLRLMKGQGKIVADEKEAV
jgi:hypothetical protein